jgi:arylsulfatase A-like enzyme
VILIAVDTLRADHLSTYGYERETSPNLDRLVREEAIRFDCAYSASSWTLPSMTSLMTSLHPHEHGVEDRGQRLHPSVPTLAAAFAGQGWYTAGFITHIYASSLFGLDTGFAEFHDVSIDWDYGEGMQVRADELNELALPWIHAHRDETFFLFLHYFDPHWDYEPPPPFDQLFTDPGYAGPARGDWRYLRKFLGADERMEPADLEHVVALYDGEIRYTDHHLGRLFEELRALDLWEDTLLVITSDHGEEFQEHGSVHHVRTLYEEVLRVPLIVKLPGGRPDGWREVVPEPVAGIDVAPTILSAAALHTPPSFEGRDLVPLFSGPGREGPVFARTIRHGSRKEALREGALKTIRTFAGRQTTFEAYDLAADPGELHPLAGATDTQAARFERVLQGRGAPDPLPPEAPEEPVELTSEQLERLRALGYIE